MNKTKFFLSLVAIGAIAMFGIFITVISPVNKTNQNASVTPTPQSNKSISMATLAQHATKDDCWMVIHGYVYDMTMYAPEHPGGEVIFEGCGKDATSMFESRPRSGTPHSDAARQLLVKYRIGTIESNP